VAVKARISRPGDQKQLASTESTAQSHHRIRLRSWEQMPIPILRQLDVGVPHHGLDRFDIGPSVDQPSRTRVTKRMEINPLALAVDRLQKIAFVRLQPLRG